MRFKKLIGRVDEDSSYILLEIEGGKNSDSIGDQVWISEDGTQMEILDYADTDVINDIASLFEGNDKRAFKGALLRMGVNID